MEADHYQATTDFQVFQRSIEATLQITQFVVDVNAQPLKGASCRILAFFPGGIGDGQHLSQIGGTFERLLDAAHHHGPRHTPSKTLFAVFLEHTGDFFFGSSGDELRGTDATRRVHAHIQRTIVEEAEAALGVIQLRRRHTQVQQHAADLTGKLADSELISKFRKASLHNDKAAVFGR